ncbi:MAG: putative glycoside hydrolase [Candidatus Kapabacteria bacterium]|nr:putative glycoside hydrolase [Candidatus Kapabacteria bacterium]
MKTPSIIFLLIILLYYTCFCQTHSWPPEPLTASTAFKNYKLLDSKIIPSSKRWNLVWADQIVPGWVSQRQFEFSANNYIGTQKIFTSQLKQFEVLNKNFLVLTYHLAAGLNPEKNDDCPNPKNLSGTGFIGVVAPKGYISEYNEYFRPWCDSNKITENSIPFESMFQHYDDQKKANRVWHSDPAWLMNLSDTNWRAYIAITCLDWMNGNRNQGVFFDVAVETNCSLYNPKATNPTPGNFDWWLSPHKPYAYSGELTTRLQFTDFMNKSYRQYFQFIYKSFHTSSIDYLIIPNVDQMITTVYDPLWLDGDSIGETIDGAMIESFGRATGQDMYLTLERTIRHITGRGKILIAQSYPDQSTNRIRLIGMYMLVKNENSYINLLSGSAPEWFPEYEIDLGNQTKLPVDLEVLRVKGTDWHSVWRRNYDNGMVLCNTSDQPIDYNPYGEYWRYIKTSGGGQIDSAGNMKPQKIETITFAGKITIPPSDCIILIKDTTSSVNNNFNSDKPTIEANPNPAIDFINMFCNNLNIHELKLFDVYGNEINLSNISDIQDVRNQLRINISNLASGVYFIRYGTSVIRFLKI